MSESQEPGRPGRYQRSPGGLLAAMVVTVLAVIAFAGFRALTTDHASTPIQSVDYTRTVAGARADHLLLVMAPARLPAGWRATSATYLTGMSPSWHLGMLTKASKYVGIEEARTSTAKLAEEHVDTHAVRGQDVTIDGSTWETWSDNGGDYAVARSTKVGGRTYESWLVVGSAPEREIRDFAGSLEGGTIRPAG